MLKTAFLVLIAASVSGAAENPQLLVMTEDDIASCRSAPMEWDSSGSFRQATPELVRQDLVGYFSGLSVQFTPILEVVRGGTVRFCAEDDESLVLETLAQLVVSPPRQAAALGLQLPPGAARFLTALASPLLAGKLMAVDPADEDEAVRQVAAVDLVREALRGSANDAAAGLRRLSSIVVPPS